MLNGRVVFTTLAVLEALVEQRWKMYSLIVDLWGEESKVDRIFAHVDGSFVESKEVISCTRVDTKTGESWAHPVVIVRVRNDYLVEPSISHEVSIFFITRFDGTCSPINSDIRQIGTVCHCNSVTGTQEARVE